MQPIGLVPLIQDGFSLKPEMRSGLLVIAVSGNGDMAAIEPLAMYLRQVRTVVTDLSMAEVQFDFRDLYFLNSSCLKSFVTWIRDMAVNNSRAFQVRLFDSSPIPSSTGSGAVSKPCSGSLPATCASSPNSAVVLEPQRRNRGANARRWSRRFARFERNPRSRGA
jgi:hypothetical protein